MAGEVSAMQRKRVATATGFGLFTGRRGRILKENLTAYLFLFPATSLILIFGIFPVAFSLYVSLYRWRLKQSNFRGLGNYVRAMDNLAYIIAFGLAVGALWLAVSYLIKAWKRAGETNQKPWLLIIPGATLALAALEFIRFAALALPEVLNIGEKIQRLVKTNELFVQFLREAFQVEAVAQARQQALWLFVGGIILLLLANRLVKTKENATFTTYSVY